MTTHQQDGTSSPESTLAAESAADAALETEKNWPPDRRLHWGMAALVLWLSLFAVGVLIPTKKSRETLGWTKDATGTDAVKEIQIKTDEKNVKIQQQISVLQKAIDAQSSATVSPLIQPAEQIAKATEALKSELTQKFDALSEEVKSIKDHNAPKPFEFTAFLMATLSFMPLNVGYLCILAAYLGGCSVNKEEVFNLETEANALPDGEARTQLKRRLEYLKENPLYSAIRGLVVYLILISGLQIIGSAPVWEGMSDKESLTNYIKLAGLFSFFGYLAGYDPTVFTSMINFGSSRLRGDSSGNKVTNPSPTTPPTP